ncbi:hypothetical protein [Trinickia sp.]|uniref:hypothetical protein n=1 Tax=Trinickia sp. TaxID=2571163 RepID=UPI003F7E7931
MLLNTYKAVAALSLAALAALAVLSVGLPHPVANAMGFLAVFAVLVAVQTPLTRSLLLVFSGFLIARYIAWRFASFPLHSALPSQIVAVALLAAELYCMAVVPFGYFVSARPLDRVPPPLPDDRAALPFVDVYIPTYSEPLAVVPPRYAARLKSTIRGNGFACSCSTTASPDPRRRSGPSSEANSPRAPKP